MIGISTDDPETALEFADYYGLEFPLLTDPDSVATQAYGLYHANGGIEGDVARPATIIVDVDGRVAWRHLTDNWRVRPRVGELLEVLEGLGN